MNIDDFIESENVATPAGLPATPSPEFAKAEKERESAHAVAAAIPIKARREPPQHMVPQSVPAATHQRNRDEFGYVTRHQRKTSIDDRRVSPLSAHTICFPQVAIRDSFTFTFCVSLISSGTRCSLFIMG